MIDNAAVHVPIAMLAAGASARIPAYVQVFGVYGRWLEAVAL